MPPPAIMVPRLYRPGTAKPWRVLQGATISPTGKKRQRWFRSKELALAWVREEEKRLRSYRDHARELTDEEKLAAAEAIPVAREHGFTLLEAVREKAERVVQQRASKTISATVADFVEQLALEKKSKSHITAAVYVGKKFAERFDDRLVCDVDTDSLQAWFNTCAKVNTPASVKNFRRYTSMFLRHALNRKWLTVNPLTSMRLRLRDDASISYLSPTEVARLLEVATPILRPYIALCAFAGLRPDEAKKLRWSDVGETVYIRKANSKTRLHRQVPILPNLSPWLSERAGEGVYFQRKPFRDAVSAAGLLPWKQDQLRHGFGSYWLALHQDETRLAAIMGNSPEIIMKHYRVPVRKADAEAYFQIMPKNSEHVGPA